MISTMGAFTIIDLRSQETTALELIKRFRRRVATEVAQELRRHLEHVQLPLLEIGPG
jgi:SAM-dependent MidA family methyltransferase